MSKQSGAKNDDADAIHDVTAMTIITCIAFLITTSMIIDIITVVSSISIILVQARGWWERRSKHLAWETPWPHNSIVDYSGL